MDSSARRAREWRQLVKVVGYDPRRPRQQRFSVAALWRDVTVEGDQTLAEALGKISFRSTSFQKHIEHRRGRQSAHQRCPLNRHAVSTDATAFWGWTMGTTSR